MCTSPLRIRNNSVYYIGINQPSHYDVPCGRCDECRSLGMSDWQTRLSYEIDALYKRNGVAVFLTFTYNDLNLPKFDFDGVVSSCFDRKGVLRFLNNLKVNAYKKFGVSSYKYFFVSEYGKHTKRPHYHALFFLEPAVNVVEFCELCRSLWRYGFMFPKFDKARGVYVDNFNKPCSVTIRSLAGGAKYVSKYVTKDLSFYNLPFVSAYIDKHKNNDLIKNALPKHWQSKKLGYSLVKEIKEHCLDTDFIENALSVGVFNPLFGKVCPLPRYVINKLMYDNVYTGRLSAEGRKLYDRDLSSFGKTYLRSKILSKLVRTTNDIYSFLFNLSYYDKYIKEYGFDKLFGLSKSYINSVSDCKPLANYMLVWKYISNREIYSHIVANYGDLSVLYDYSFAVSQYVLQHDTSYFRNVCKTEFWSPCRSLSDSSIYVSSLLKEFDYIVYCYNVINSRIRYDRCQHFNNLHNAVDKMRLYFNGFPNNLC